MENDYMVEKQNKPSVPQSQAQFLSDRPLTAETKQNDRFGHSGIAENLKQIILTCPIPFTIGLFGKWGTGKTSILNLLKGELSPHRLPVVTFDVWKHEGDALRRTFLTAITEELKDELPKGFKLSERLDRTIETEKEVKKPDLPVYIVTAVIVVLMLIVGLFFYRIDLNLFKTYFSVVTSGSLVSALLLWLFQHIVIKSHITETTERFKDPHEFEKEFFRIIRNIKSDSDRVLIALDNLDRCSHKRAVELLSTIKTFLASDADAPDKNKCVFLITCDDKAIKKHLQFVYRIDDDNLSFSPDEFLRKFFNASLTLPDFIDIELHSYTEELLAETTIPQFNNSDVAHVVTAAFRDNPRQTKQFINMLIAHFLMAQNRENMSKPMIVPKGAITDNVAFLAKYLIVRQKFPLEYQQITNKFLPPEEWGDLGNTDFKNFHTATNMITVTDIRLFIYLKQSEEELQIPGLRQIERGLIENNVDIVSDKLRNVKEKPDKNRYFNKFLLDLLRRYRYVKTSLINIFGCSLSVSSNLKIDLSDEFYRHFAHLLNDSAGLRDSLSQFSPELVFSEVLTRCKDEYRKGIIAEYVSYFCKTRDEKDTIKISADEKTGKSSIGRDFAYDILKEFVKNRDLLTDNQKSKIRKAIENSYSGDIEVLSLFEKDVKNQNDFISEQTLSKFVSTFSTDDVDDKELIDEKIRFLLKFKTIIKFKATENILVKLQELLDAENKLPLDEVEKDEISRKKNLLGLIEDILSTLSDELKDSQLQTQLNSFADKLSQGFEALGNWNDRRLFIFSCLSIVDLLDDPHKTKIDQLIQNFFTNGDSNSIQFVFDNDKLRKNNKTQLISRYPKVFKTRVIADQSIFDYLYSIASKEIKSEWLVDLINSDPKRAVEKLESLRYKTDDNKNIVQALLQKVTAVAVQEKTPIYKTINEMKCANDAALKNSLGSQIQDLLKTTDTKNQEVGYETFDGASSYLSEATRRNVAAEVIDWLRSPALPNPYQPNSVKSVILNWDILAQTPKNDYIYFIFHNLIMPKVNIDTIRLGFEVLSEINVLYDGNTKTYFDDTLSSAENETKQDIKAVIIDGLMLLKPQKSEQKDKAFWTKVQKLQE